MMFDYFKSWRRMIGIVTLVIAIAFVALWSRSFQVVDEISTSSLHIASISGHLFVEFCPAQLKWERVEFYSANPARVNDPYSAKRFAALWKWKWGGFAYGAHRGEISLLQRGLLSIDIYVFNVPHLAIVATFTLISACFLLRRPRPAEPNHA